MLRLVRTEGSHSLPIRREFLDHRRPAPASAADWLIGKFLRGKQVDLRHTTIVVPGRRAGRRLLEVLVARCEAQKLILNPPEITTEGSFPERLYTPRRPFADRLTQQLAWAKALAETPAEDRARVVPTTPTENHRRQLQLGEMLRKQHAELAADGLDFKDVADRGPALDGFDEVPRWRAMAKVQRRYLDILDGLKLWDVQTARLEAVKRREPATDRELILFGTVDLNITLRKMLDLVADRVTALIFAPADHAEMFDSHGCLQIDAWNAALIPIRDEQVFRAEGPADQAAEAARLVAQFGGTRRADEITLGVADESMVPQLQRQFQECGVPTRWVVGTPLTQTGPYRFLVAAADFISRRDYADFAALVRHPDVHTFVRGRVAAEFLTALDRYYGRHLPSRLDGEWHGKPEDHTAAREAAEKVDELLVDLTGEPRSLEAWSQGVRKTFERLYADRRFDRNREADRALLDACEAIENVLQSFADVPAELQPLLSLREVVPLILDPLAAEATPPPAMPAAVEILGWLELALDDAPALVVTTFNEGFVPQSHVADAFLPNRMREHLGLLNNQRRYARDAYAVSAILGSRPDAAFIVGKRDADRNPLAPSRLLFATDPERVVARAQRYFRESSPRPPRKMSLTNVPPPERSRFDVPAARLPERTLEAISVTQFRAYLACKYRFYLQHILKLAELDDAAAELDPGLFGDLVHDVLQDFGRTDEVNQSGEPNAILKYLEARLEGRVKHRFGGRSRRGAINLQIEQIRTRLKTFAEWQAGRVAEGWKIAFTEDFEQRLEAVFPVDHRTVKLVGRIDRIDVNLRSGVWQVLDYKTSDSPKDPAQVHRSKDGAWLDLQLPLYRHLVRNLDLPDGRVEGTLQFGYIQLPKDASLVKLAPAQWNEDDLRSADDAAREVVRNIWDGLFEPRTDPPPDYAETWAAICQDRLLDRVKPAIVAEAEGDA